MAKRGGRQPSGDPKGFEVVSFAIPPEPRMPNVLPKRAVYHDLILRLSGKIIGDAKYSESAWSEQDGVKVKTRQRKVPQPIPGLSFLVREKHEADAAEEDSLMRIYGTDGGLGTMMQDGQRIRPLKLTVYDAREKATWDVVLGDLPASTPQEELFGIADMEIASGDVPRDTPIARHSLYLGLAFGAHEPPPPVTDFRGYKNFGA